MSFTPYNNSIKQCNFCKTMVSKGATSCYLCHDKPISKKSKDAMNEYYAHAQRVEFGNDGICEKCGEYCSNRNKKCWKCSIYPCEICGNKKSPNENCYFCQMTEHEKQKNIMNKLIFKNILTIQQINDKNVLKEILIFINSSKRIQEDNLDKCKILYLNTGYDKIINDLCEEPISIIHSSIKNELIKQIYNFNLVKLNDKKITEILNSHNIII